MNRLNVETELCTAPSGAFYIEVYAIGTGRELAHRTRRCRTVREAENAARTWLMLKARPATMARFSGAEPVPAA